MALGKYLLLLVVVVTISMINCGRDISPEKLQKNLQKINKQLEKNVASDDASANLAEIERMLEEQSQTCKHSIIKRGHSLEDTLRTLIYYADIPKNIRFCDRHTRTQTGEKLDAALSHKDESKSDHQWTRLDKILAHWARENLRQCFGYMKLPQMEHLTKQIQYDWINSQLVDRVPEKANEEAQMKEIDDLLYASDKSGARADALRLIQKLRSTTKADSCNMEGYQILLANDFATRKRAHDRYLRRVDKLFLHYVEQHELVCRPIYIDNFRRDVQQLDAQTYRSILGLLNVLTNFDLIPSTKEIIDKRYERLDNKEVNADFYTPFIEECVRDELTRMTVFDIQSLVRTGQVRAVQLYAFIEIAAASDPNEKYLRPVASEAKQEGSSPAPPTIREQELKALADKYLFEPCRVFLNKFEEQVEMADYGLEFNSARTDRVISDDKRLSELMTFNLVRGAVGACQYVHYDRKHYEDELIRLAKTGGREVIIMDRVRLGTL